MGFNFKFALLTLLFTSCLSHSFAASLGTNAGARPRKSPFRSSLLDNSKRSTSNLGTSNLGNSNRGNSNFGNSNFDSSIFDSSNFGNSDDNEKRSPKDLLSPTKPINTPKPVSTSKPSATTRPSTSYPTRTGSCKPTGCTGTIRVQKGRKSGTISPGTCGGSCGASSCEGTVRCITKRIRRGRTTIISARPSGQCVCRGPQPSNVIRFTEEMAMNGPTGDHRIDKLLALNNM